jgi:hypothetical protein
MLTWFLLALLSPGGGQPTSSAATATLEVQTERTYYRVGEPIRLRLAFKNQGDP